MYIYMHKPLHGKIQCGRKLKDAHSVVGFLFRMLGLFLITGEVPDPWFPTLAVVLLFEDSSTSVITSEIFSPFKWVEKCCMSCQRVFPQCKGSRLICFTHCGGSTASTVCRVTVWALSNPKHNSTAWPPPWRQLLLRYQWETRASINLLIFRWIKS